MIDDTVGVVKLLVRVDDSRVGRVSPTFLGEGTELFHFDLPLPRQALDRQLDLVGFEKPQVDERERDDADHHSDAENSGALDER